MDMQSLHLFVRAAEMRNISAAGRSLGMAPAAASARLAKLEREMGADLLHRTTRQVALSVEGEALLPYAREMLAQEQAARAALGQGSETVRGTLRFAAPSTFAQLYLGEVLAKALSTYPEIELDLRLTDLQQDLIEGSFDLALRNHEATDTSLKGRKLADDLRILCAAPRYLGEWGRPETPEALTNHRLIGFQSLGARPLISADGRRGQFAPRAARACMAINDGASQRAATIAGCGVSVNSLWAVARDLEAGRLVRVLPRFHVDEVTALWLLYPKSNVLTAKVRVFIDLLLAELAPALPLVSDA